MSKYPASNLIYHIKWVKTSRTYSRNKYVKIYLFRLATLKKPVGDKITQKFCPRNVKIRQSTFVPPFAPQQVRDATRGKVQKKALHCPEPVIQMSWTFFVCY